MCCGGFFGFVVSLFFVCSYILLDTAAWFFGTFLRGEWDGIWLCFVLLWVGWCDNGKGACMLHVCVYVCCVHVCV